MKIKLFFHYISYLQYPLMLVGLYFVIKPYINGFDTLFIELNNALIFMGLGISFSTLQDTTKTQNDFSKKVWQSPKKGKFFIALISIMALFFIILGLIGFLSVKDGNLQDLAIGLIVLGIGLIGLLKAAVEMFEHNQIDNQNKPQL